MDRRKIATFYKKRKTTRVPIFWAAVTYTPSAMLAANTALYPETEHDPSRHKI